MLSILTNARSTYLMTFQVGGMTCTSCSSAIEQRLKELPGVVQASVSLLSNRAEVRHLHPRSSTEMTLLGKA